MAKLIIRRLALVCLVVAVLVTLWTNYYTSTPQCQIWRGVWNGEEAEGFKQKGPGSCKFQVPMDNQSSVYTYSCTVSGQGKPQISMKDIQFSGNIASVDGPTFTFHVEGDFQGNPYVIIKREMIRNINGIKGVEGETWCVQDDPLYKVPNDIHRNYVDCDQFLFEDESDSEVSFVFDPRNGPSQWSVGDKQRWACEINERRLRQLMAKGLLWISVYTINPKTEEWQLTNDNLPYVNVRALEALLSQGENGNLWMIASSDVYDTIRESAVNIVPMVGDRERLEARKIIILAESLKSVPPFLVSLKNEQQFAPSLL